MQKLRKLTAKTTLVTGFKLLVAMLLCGLMPFASVVHAQGNLGGDADLFPNFSLGNFGNPAGEPVQWSARYFADPAGGGLIEVEADLAPTWHVYSVTQPPGGPTRTKITVTAPEKIKTTGEFIPDAPPAKSISSVYNGLTVEEHEGLVIWTAPINLPVGFEDTLTVKVNGLVCKSGDGRCMPVKEELTAEFAGLVGTNATALQSLTAVDPPAGTASPAKVTSAATFRDGEYVVQWTATVAPPSVAAGGKAVLKFTAKPDATFHVYKSTTDDSDSATNFVITDKGGMKIGAPVADQPLITKSILPTLPPVSYYAGKVTWSLPIEVPTDAAAGTTKIEGMIAYQACTENACHQPVALKFTVNLNIGDEKAAGPSTIQFTSAKSAEALDAAATTEWVDPIKLPGGEQPNADVSSDDASDQDQAIVVAGPSNSRSLPLVLALAFLGGIILNVMPCVLPVVGLKIMGFVSQAGEDRGRILLLNLVYASGILAVFAALAVLAVVFKFGWGEQFTYFPVRLGLTLLLFALALSYLGVWEIPAPGMASSKASQELQNREGLLGAFSKGVFATVLATPCSGPLLGAILGLTLGLSSLETVAIFMTVGLGMALPYLVVGASPRLISWLPKPGMWMETLKQFMSFLFLATVAFFFAQFDDEHKVPVFVALIGVWFGCWIIGQVPNWAELQKRLLAWGSGIAAATAIGVAAFTYLVPGPTVLAWEDYSEVRLQQLQREGRTVLLDFSAKWCVNCIYNYEVAINTQETRRLVDELDAVAMYADYTNFDDEIKEKLEELESRSIPLLAIYPGNRPNEPIVLRDLVTQEAVLEALRTAGASVDGTATARNRSLVSSSR